MVSSLANDLTQVYYHSFTDVANGEVDLSIYDAIWIQFDGGWWGDRVAQFPKNGANCIIGEGPADGPPCSDLADKLINKVKTYYQAGGNILVGNFAVFILDDIGVVDANGILIKLGEEPDMSLGQQQTHGQVLGRQVLQAHIFQE